MKERLLSIGVMKEEIYMRDAKEFCNKIWCCIFYCSHVNLGEESYPPIPPNGKWLSPKFEKSEIGNFRKQTEFSQKIKFGGCSWKGIDIGQLKITGKPIKYIVPEIYDRNMKKGKFAKQMNA